MAKESDHMRSQRGKSVTLPPELTPSVRIVFCRIGVPEQEVDDAQKAIYTGTDHSEPA